MSIMEASLVLLVPTCLVVVHPEQSSCYLLQRSAHTLANHFQGESYLGWNTTQPHSCINDLMSFPRNCFSFYIYFRFIGRGTHSGLEFTLQPGWFQSYSNFSCVSFPRAGIKGRSHCSRKSLNSLLSNSSKFLFVLGHIFCDQAWRLIFCDFPP